MSTIISDTERLNHLNWRLKRLESCLGKSNKLEKKQINDIINDLNENVQRVGCNNNNAKTLLNKADEINRLTSSEFQRNLLADRTTKLELILADEHRIREITKNLSEVDKLANILDEKCFQDIPKLLTSLNKLLVIHNDFKNQHNGFTQELSTFLQDYAAFTLLMDENLQQYKQILNKSQKASSEIPDDPIE